MNCFAVLLVCFQTCLIQNVFSQCYGAAPYAYGPAIASGSYPSYGMIPEIVTPVAAYGGEGIGDVMVTGEMPVAGTTCVVGQVPILGAVRFTGELPACGTVSLSGSCGCGCGSYYY